MKEYKIIHINETYESGNFFPEFKTPNLRILLNKLEEVLGNVDKIEINRISGSYYLGTERKQFKEKKDLFIASKYCDINTIQLKLITNKGIKLSIIPNLQFMREMDLWGDPPCYFKVTKLNKR